VSGTLDQSSTGRRLLIAAVIALAIIVTTGAMLPFASRPMPVMPSFLPMYATTVCLIEGLTAYFLTIQFRASGSAFLGGLAGAYGYVAVMSALQVATFPGAFSPSGLFGAGPQSAIWLWVMWHGGFPGLVLLALLTRTRIAKILFGARLARAGLALLIGGPVAAIVLAYLAVAGGGVLPPLISANSYHLLNRSPAAYAVVLILLLSIAACVRITRLRDLLSLWIAVSLLASLADVVVILAASARFSLGWYGGRLLGAVSSSVVLCVLIFELTRLYQRLVRVNGVLAEQALRDGLTRAFNRFYFDEQFPRELRRAAREQAPLSLLMIDVDHFKNFNDSNGHHMGDRCLIEIVGALQTALRRPGDFLARYGGEEFVALLPRTGEDGAAVQAEAMRQAVAALGISRGPGGAGAAEIVTISLGIATIDPVDEEIGPAELLQRADAALYAAKRGGRNRVHMHVEGEAESKKKALLY
jgi:diguanylate cyclase (GGDEF)-like protein